MPTNSQTNYLFIYKSMNLLISLVSHCGTRFSNCRYKLFDEHFVEWVNEVRGKNIER